MAWEAMSVSSLLLVYTEHEREDVRRSGLIYLIASHLGVVILFILFVVLSGSSNSFDFAGMATTSRSRVLSDWCFGLALVGFGLKAGFWPMHVWLPEAHPAAPSHVSAVMSGVMLKLGIYGILRASFWLGPPPVEWGITLVVIGATSSLGGVLHALGQTDIKRLLAYSSVENIGIIALALGVGMLGQSESLPVVTYLGYAAALIHGLNHGLMKGLLFHCAGAIAHATRTRNIESLGGLSRQMPVTAAAFLLGAIAISGLPPLNGFIGELLLYFGALHAAAVVPGAGATASLVVVPTLALTGAIACACFVRTYGIIFLGIPRSAATERAHEIGWTTATAMIIGGTLSVAIGLSPMLALSLVNAPVVELVRANVDPAGVVDGIAMAARVTALLVALVIALGCVRKLLFRGRPVSRASTWGCGYDAPTPRMQYTATSFAAPLLAPFDGFYPTRVHRDGPSGYFPTRAHFERRYVDIPADLLFVPAMRRIVRLLGRLHVLQQGHIHTYLVYILAVLIGLLVWVLVLPTALGSP
jgi:formate hydrogenlyase subunit 3/multisubunit Na+/H+ antiporter MnhD subunit